MLAAEILAPGPENEICLMEKPRPVCGAHEVLIRVEAFGVNRADILQRQGKYPPPPGSVSTPGLECAGRIAAVGENVCNFSENDAVFALVAAGACAEYCLADARLVRPIPRGWSFIEAAALAEALVTAHATVFELGALKSGETLLMHGAGSGITSLAIQMARLIGAQIITTANHPEKCEKALQYGAHRAINHTTEDFLSLCGESSVDVAVDFIGGDYVDKHLRLLKSCGRLIQIACMQNHQCTFNLARLVQKRLCLQGFVLRSQAADEKAMLFTRAINRWWPALQEGAIKPVIDAVFPFDELASAHQRLQDSRHFGKIIVCPPLRSS
ncbi:quinone oxidoreductase [Legionella geestiana]|uniref:Quinone oxidoreductase n=1 Tax=Legionella geestiana TaxID=45065 RepID=A0A0W0TRH7_9GAMM|nr:NAD(P)H-quinone oxidoreductase [Legionella geestiana]KTC98323.1 quinone oxidoreductase [Legionella geestiana]QBS11370.1 NAD(P)H-quinone oxidoreductase [Legionella geestiana]QDQ38922.1 NAD(P)H-quinone oxidoreductase [Legionella geestiana]STX53976.1 quinone oxidoreductase [Legionella geestiana]